MSREIVSFNNGWKYISNFKEEYIAKNFDDKDFEEVRIPHTSKETPYNCFDENMYQFKSCYRKEFIVSEEYSDKQVYIDFDGVMAYADVYVNGKEVGDHKGGYTNFSFDITDFIEFGKENTIAVMVDSTERSDIPPFGFVIDYLTYGGIYREVSLRIVDKLHVNNVFVKTQNVLEDKKSIETKIFINNSANNADQYTVKAELLDDQDNKVASITTEINTDDTDKEIILRMDDLSDIKLWDTKEPNLYTVKVLIEKDGTLIDTYSTKIGFREAEFTTDGFKLNGEVVNIRGLNRHQAFPYMGYAMPARSQKKDADILKYDLGLNLVRTSHYPQSVHFLNRCDEIGLLVFEEIPGWQHIGDEEWKKVACENVREMITRDFNHPSIILWGVRINESGDDHDFYTESNKIAHELDDSRQTGGVRCFPNSELLEDVYTMNDFIHRGEDEILRDQQVVTGLDKKVPYIVTEYAGHTYPTKRFDQEERINEHVLRHIKIQDAAAYDKDIAGAIGWCAFDYNTHYQFGSGDRICYHGVMDMFRIPKQAAYVYKSQVEPSEEVVLEPVTIWALGERDGGGISNMIVLTNCDKIEYYVGDKLRGEFKPAYDQFKGLKHPPVLVEDTHGLWGAVWEDAKFIGYIDGKEVITKTYAKDPVATKLIVEVDDLTLDSGDMDATRIVYKIVDQQGNILPYINETVNLEVTGVGEQMGPKNLTLIGGCLATWIKTNGQKGQIKVNANCSRFAADEVIINVE